MLTFFLMCISLLNIWTSSTCFCCSYFKYIAALTTKVIFCIACMCLYSQKFVASALNKEKWDCNYNIAFHYFCCWTVLKFPTSFHIIYGNIVWCTFSYIFVISFEVSCEAHEKDCIWCYDVYLAIFDFLVLRNWKIINYRCVSIMKILFKRRLSTLCVQRTLNSSAIKHRNEY